MNKYRVVYINGDSEIIEAVGCNCEGNSFVFLKLYGKSLFIPVNRVKYIERQEKE